MNAGVDHISQDQGLAFRTFLHYRDKGQKHENCFKTETVGAQARSTDVTHPLLTSVHCPFSLLRSFKEGAHQSKTDFIILSDTHALCNVHACLRPTKTSFFTTRQISVCMYETPGRLVRKGTKTIFAYFKGYSVTHAC